MNCELFRIREEHRQSAEFNEDNHFCVHNDFILATVAEFGRFKIASKASADSSSLPASHAANSFV